jgi:heme oxygenase (biliverdin-IX-beta and delta-forming)
MADSFSLSLTAHARLRGQTRAEHEAAERTPVMRALLEGRLEAAGYQRLLQGQYALHAAWEARHADWIATGLRAAGWHYASRRERLAADLAEWQLRPETEPTAPEAATGSQAVGSASASWGELYVIEGSALGGQVLVALLEKRFPDHAHHFFRIGKDAARGSWRTFQSMLDRHLPDPAHQQVAIEAAKTMFHRAQRMLEAVLP